jgi:hypothetical protein
MAFDHRRDPLAQADAHGRQPEARILPLHRVEQRRRDARAGTAQRMT